MEFRVLGPFEVVDEELGIVPLGAAKERALLALLVLHADEVVSSERMIDELWGERPPESATNVLHTYISHLRRTLEPGRRRGVEGLIVTRPPGYLLRLEPGQLDLHRFEELVHEARSTGDPAQALMTLNEALALWRGPPLQEFAFDGFAQAEISRIEELHLAAVERRIEIELALGRDGDHVAELEALVAVHPLRERLVGQLMLALYRAGRQAEALEVYRTIRRRFADELGIEPGTELQELHRAILNHDASLDARAPHVRADGARRDRRIGASVWLPALAGVIAAAVAIPIFAFGQGGDGTSVEVATGDSVGFVDAQTNRLVADVPVGTTPTAVISAAGAIWVTNTADGTVDRIDPVTHTIRQTVRVGNGPSGIAFGDGSVWVTNGLSGTVSRISPGTNRVVETIDVGNGPAGIVFASGSIWVANTGDGTITRIDPESGQPDKTLNVAATELAFGAGTLWASQRTANRVARIDPETGDVQSIEVGNGPTGIAFGSRSAWVANSLDGTLARIDPETSSVADVIPVGNGPTAVAADSSGVWVSNAYDGTVVRVDPRTSQVARRIDIGNRPQGMGVSEGEALVSIGESDAAHRGGALIVRNPAIVESIDTALADSTTEWMLLRMTNDGLVAFNETSGLAGAQLVPDLALSLPTPTNDGKTYVFHLRPGIRYSTGGTVRPSDVRATFERDFEAGSAPYAGGIVGASRCIERPRRCDLSDGIVANDAARTVTFHLVAADPNFLYKLALPNAFVLPAGTPLRARGTHPLPATGPYVIASYRPQHSVRFVRNRSFHEWSKAAQPDGYPNQILFEMVDTPDQAVKDVIEGRADAFGSIGGLPSQDLLEQLQTRFADRVRSNPYQRVFALFLNTRVRPFDSLDARRALNYAADRAAAVSVAGGPDAAQATCQILPPDFPGYRSYCPYSKGASADGRWRAPDLAKARALVDASGTRGMKVTFWSWAPAADFGVYAVKLLRSLGYRATLRVLSRTGYFSVANDPRTRAQIGFMPWTSDYPAPSGFFDPLLTCASRVQGPANANAAGFCDPRIDRAISDAMTTQTRNPDAARGLWERIDRQTVDEAPWVPLVSPKIVNVLSKRVGNFQYNPMWSMLIDQLWVR